MNKQTDGHTSDFNIKIIPSDVVTNILAVFFLFFCHYSFVFKNFGFIRSVKLTLMLQTLIGPQNINIKAAFMLEVTLVIQLKVQSELSGILLYLRY